VNTNHGHTNRPCCFSDTESQVAVVCIHITTFL
jgi:hypothetical protein